MPFYNVTITATVTKTLTVETVDKDKAYEVAHEHFHTECEGVDENYNEETDSVVEISEPPADAVIYEYSE
jgi:hypothetical protein